MADQDRSPHAGISLDRRAAFGAFIKSSAIGLGGILAAQPAQSAESPPHPVAETVLNVKAFGAKGDGVTDDTAAINACISACGVKGGGAIYFPSGKYVISSTILINHSHVAILGAGWGNTVFVPRLPAGDVFVFGDKTHAPVLNKMADFSIHPSVPMTSGALIHVQNGNGIILSDFEIDGGFSGLSIDDLSLQSGVHVRDFIIVNTRHAAILIGQNSPPPYQPNEVFLTNGTISQCLIGLDLIYVDGLYVSALSIYKSANVGVRFGPTEKTVVSDSLFVNCVTDSTVSGDGWQFTGSGVIANIALDNCVTSYNHGNGVSVQPGTRLNGLGIRGGIYQFCENAGISVNSTQAKNILIQGVQVGFNSKAARGQYAGIYFAAGVSDFTVDACMIGAVGTMTFVAKNLQGWGIMVAEGGSDGYIITNNRSVSNTAGGVRDGGSGKNKTVSGNVAVP
ncbi:MAG: glycosyl hydrolase family 28-related protein [Thermoguttaceae bacterium]